MAHSFRCDCPITSALDVLGDKWTLVIVKQMLIDGKKTFKAGRLRWEEAQKNMDGRYDNHFLSDDETPAEIWDFGTCIM